MSDLTNWLTEPETARRVRVTERTLRTWASQGRVPARNGQGELPLERKYRKRAGNRDEPVYNPRDVEILQAAAEAEASKPVVVDRHAPLPAREFVPQPVAAPAWNFGALAPFLERLTSAFEKRLEPAKPLVPWVTMAEAAAITGLSENLLRSLVRTGKLGCLRDKQGWKVKRSDLEGLEASKLRQATAELRQNLAQRKAGS